MRNSVFLLLLIPLLDIIFLVSFTMIFHNSFAGTADTLEEVNQIIKQQTEHIQNENRYEALLLSKRVEELLNVIYWSVATILIGLLVTWTFTQGTVWFLLSQAFQSHVPWLRRVIRLLAVSVTGFVVFLAVLACSVALLRSSLGADSQSGWIMFATGVCATLLLYALVSAYAHGSMHTDKTRHLIRSYPAVLKKTAIPFITFAATFVGANFVLIKALNYHIIIPGAILMFIVLPSLVITRAWITAAASGKSMRNLIS